LEELAIFLFAEKARRRFILILLFMRLLSNKRKGGKRKCFAFCILCNQLINQSTNKPINYSTL
jgi:hypothetical protein